jgi:hypothetical protein
LEPYVIAPKTYFTFPPVEDAALSKIPLAVRGGEADKNKFILACDVTGFLTIFGFEI